MKQIIFVLLSIFVTSKNLYSQEFFKKKQYLKENIGDPLKIPYSFAGNFGECRPNHFHSGLDFRTEGKENLPVYAVLDGYISRIKIEKGGFGNAIYITHLNGYTTVYAHLNRFYPLLEKYVRDQQYKNKTWKIDIPLLPHQFIIKKGQLIAYSGNTGNSSGPHLHLEIRDSKTESPLNPLLFFKVNDTKKPILKGIAVYNADKSIYEQTPNILQVSNGKLKKDTINVSSKSVYFGVSADDFIQNMPGILGVFELRLFVNEKPFFAWQLDDISYDSTRYMNAHADYKHKKLNNQWVQLCAKLPNDKLNIYKSFSPSNGRVDLSDMKPKKIRIELYDASYNSNVIEFYIQTDNKNLTSSSAATCKYDFKAGAKNKLSNQDISIELNEDALYDNICFDYKKIETNNPYSDEYQIHFSYVPIHSKYKLRIKPKTEIPQNYKSKVAIVRTDNAGNSKSKNGIAAIVMPSGIEIETNSFGVFKIVIDQTPPNINTTLKNNTNISQLKKISFQVTEETTSLKSCNLYAGEQWLRLVQSGNTFTYELDDNLPKGKNILKMIAVDENDNTTEKIFIVNR
ncbi:MAG TPA: M23 family metallopeptidase [Chitinophagaceae bacterium]|nr:MAG: peptidase M23 [Bacteroidetes bacterium OLB11]HMN32263.1 M23 family metallopeptidase [Chitinophagaceae bacterium]